MDIHALQHNYREKANHDITFRFPFRSLFH